MGVGGYMWIIEPLIKKQLMINSPIPVIDELFDELNVSKIFFKIELRPRYHQIRVILADVEKTTY